MNKEKPYFESETMFKCTDQILAEFEDDTIKDPCKVQSTEEFLTEVAGVSEFLEEDGEEIEF